MQAQLQHYDAPQCALTTEREAAPACRKLPNGRAAAACSSARQQRRQRGKWRSALMQQRRDGYSVATIIQILLCVPLAASMYCLKVRHNTPGHL